MLITQLSSLQVGDSARVINLGRSDRAYRYKLLAMGLTPNTEFTLIRKAPLGDPLEIHVRGYSLTLRKDEAALLEIERLP